MNRYNCFDVIFNNHIAQIILNRPEKRNSMTTDFWNEFPEIISKINEDGEKLSSIKLENLVGGIEHFFFD